jgi:hypothetical protein
MELLGFLVWSNHRDEAVLFDTRSKRLNFAVIAKRVVVTNPMRLNGGNPQSCAVIQIDVQ